MYRFNRPITALLVITSPLWLVPMTVLVSLIVGLKSLPAQFREDVYAGYRWSIQEPLYSFYDNQVLYRIWALRDLAALPFSVLVHLLRGAHLVVIRNELVWTWRGAWSALRTGSYLG